MLFNCFSCGRTISSKKDICVYCKTDTSHFVQEFNKERQKTTLKEKYPGTLLSFLLKTKVR